MTKITDTKTKPAKAKTGKVVAKGAPKLTIVPTVTNKTPDSVTPAKRVRKPKAVTTAPALVEVKTAPVAVPDPVAPVAAVPVAVTPVKRGAGRPLSSDAAKVRRRVLGAFQKLAATGEIEVTVKATAKAVKLKKVTVSNTIRWAESEGILKRIGYKLKAGPGRKEVFYTLDPVKLAEAAKVA